MEFLERYWVSLAVALGCGLLIGIERERRKGHGAARGPAGVRTFAMASLAGALAQALDQPLLVAAGAALVLLLAAISHWKSPTGDPGITTEIALFVAFVLGVTSIQAPPLAAAVAAVVTILLASRNRLHRFSTRMLTAPEARDGLVLAVAALVVLPLMPDQPLAWLSGVQPRSIWQLVVMLLAVQAVGHVAVRAMGPRVGLAMSGMASGFASSTATFAAMGARARAHPEQVNACASGALFSNVATFAQLALVAATVSPAVLAAMWGLFALGAGAAAVAALVVMLRAQPAERGPGHVRSERAFDLPRSLVFAAVLAGVTTLAAWVGDRFGSQAALAGAALAGFVDVHASLASMCTLVESGRTSASGAVVAVLLGLSTNTMSKLVAAWMAGGTRFGLRVLPGLVAMLAAAWATLLVR